MTFNDTSRNERTLSGVLALAIIPWGDVQHGVGLYGIDVPIGILYFFAVGSIAFYGVLLGGWSSGSKYSLLGAMLLPVGEGRVEHHHQPDDDCQRGRA